MTIAALAMTLVLVLGFAWVCAPLFSIPNRADDRPRFGRAAHNARRDTADRWKSLEDAHTEECLAALTSEDVAGLEALGWEPPTAIRKPRPGDEVMTLLGPVTLGVRAATPDELRFDPYADGTLKRPMSLVSRDGAC